MPKGGCLFPPRGGRDDLGEEKETNKKGERSLREEAEGVSLGAVLADLEVEMATCGTTGGAHSSDQRSSLDGGVRAHQDLAEVCV